MNWLGVSQDTPEETNALIDLEGSDEQPAVSDRAAAIIGGSLVEHYLTEILKSYLRKNPKITGELFRPAGALGFFGTKVSLGFLIGVYGEESRRDLQIIVSLRNWFAHELWTRDFDVQKIAAHRKNLTIVDLSIKKQSADGFAGLKIISSGSIPDADDETGFIFGPKILYYTNDYEDILSNPRKRYILAAMLYITLFSSYRHPDPRRLYTDPPIF
jgi:hypothetical protein